MGTRPGLPHDPLLEKRTAVVETLNRRRQTASETSTKVAEDRSAFFDKLAVLNAGALTFSVTLLGTTVQQDAHSLFILYAAWVSLLITLGACLVRSFSHQGYRFSDPATKRAECEISYIAVHSEIVSATPTSIMY